MKKIKNNQAIAHTTNSKKLTNAWKKPISFLLGLSILACSSAICLAGTEREQSDSKHASSQVSQESRGKEMTKEELAIFKHRIRFYGSLYRGTWFFLMAIGCEDTKSYITAQEEKIIRDMDTLIKKRRPRPLDKTEEEQLFSLTLKLVLNKRHKIDWKEIEEQYPTAT